MHFNGRRRYTAVLKQERRESGGFPEVAGNQPDRETDGKRREAGNPEVFEVPPQVAPHAVTRAIWDSARQSAYRCGHGPEFDQLAAEGEELQRALRLADASTKDAYLEQLAANARNRASLTRVA